MKKHISLTLFSLWMASGYSMAQSTNMAPASPGSTMPAAITLHETAMTEAEVRKIDAAGGKITLKHGEIKNIEMPAMTMVFQVKDRGFLTQVKAGDKVKFTADKIKGAYTVLSIEVIQ
jgi:Cu(I)/Ag(I) efflux system protein CusF